MNNSFWVSKIETRQGYFTRPCFLLKSSSSWTETHRDSLYDSLINKDFLHWSESHNFTSGHCNEKLFKALVFVSVIISVITSRFHWIYETHIPWAVSLGWLDSLLYVTPLLSPHISCLHSLAFKVDGESKRHTLVRDFLRADVKMGLNADIWMKQGKKSLFSTNKEIYFFWHMAWINKWSQGGHCS